MRGVGPPRATEPGCGAEPHVLIRTVPFEERFQCAAQFGRKVVVVQPTALEADAWATALNVLGENEGYALAERLQIPALFIANEDGGWVHRMTAAFLPYLTQPPS